MFGGVYFQEFYPGDMRYLHKERLCDLYLRLAVHCHHKFMTSGMSEYASLTSTIVRMRGFEMQSVKQFPTHKHIEG